MVIDDSFVHSVWHNGTAPRIILIVDVWHPEMDGAAREASLEGNGEGLRVYRGHQAAPPGVLWEEFLRRRAASGTGEAMAADGGTAKDEV